MVGWHHGLDEHEFEQAPGDGEGQESLACYSPWGCKELDATEELNNLACQTCTTCSEMEVFKETQRTENSGIKTYFSLSKTFKPQMF